jgi:hypothetical protein
MSTNVSGHMSNIGKIAVSEKAKRQIGAEAKVCSADSKLRGANFLDTFPEFSEVPGIEMGAGRLGETRK